MVGPMCGNYPDATSRPVGPDDVTLRQVTELLRHGGSETQSFYS